MVAAGSDWTSHYTGLVGLSGGATKPQASLRAGTFLPDGSPDTSTRAGTPPGAGGGEPELSDTDTSTSGEICTPGPGACDACANDYGGVRPAQRTEMAMVFGAMVNLTRTIVGAGVLCLPFALQEGGAGLGVISLAATGVFSLIGFLAIGRACHATGARTYREAWRRTVGTSPVLVDVMILFECILTCVGYVILILDYLGTGLQGLAGLPTTAGTRARLAGAVTVVCLIPLCLRPCLDSLKFSSLFGNVAMLYTITFVILECLAWDDRDGFLQGATFLSSERDGVFRATCVMTSAYIAHYSAPDFLAELSGHSRPWQGFFMASAASFGLSLVAYWLFAVAGYERFGAGVLGNVLLNYDSTLCALLAWVSMAATLIVSFPLIFKPARDVMAQVLALQPPPTTGGLQKELRGPAWARPWALMTALAVVATVLAGVCFRDISRVLAFRGALLGCPISFILPGLMLMNCPEGSMRKSTIGAWLLILFGTLAGSLGLYCTFQS
mmetsp:Transcript_3770/g.10430  ORF Transcript_3770/g.10430 Transcript_3770/m.10430 type:complete len:498 (-) Transcript_3770:112-1605(-)|eukprot:CAMPEP_0179023908 /NCGR_PEP_ID=MMETSP0796-20121207/7180_1 /TAXON_ID=73915 /ORGANISM="Pyrodinium bahamense, Strain pbaha01" /LENGTH=497 /DNA_ID=CAMNT_0020719849 /DNA_START=84 /DNA_END=1577 /DNA_ORIENTATION=-